MAPARLNLWPTQGQLRVVEGHPIERIFAILAGYRDPENRPVHALIAEIFQGWIMAIRECLGQAKKQLPKETDLDALTTYVLSVMEGGVMLSHSYGTVEPFDKCVDQLRVHFRLLIPPLKITSRSRRA